MRWVCILAVALSFAPTMSVAQTESLPVYGGFRFGMTVGQALAVNPGLQPQSFGGGTLTLLQGGSPAIIGGLSFSPLLAFRSGRLSTVTFRARGLVRNGAQCDDALVRVVSALETSVGALSGPPALNEYSAPRATRNTSGGSTVRLYEFQAFQHSNGFANQRGPGWVSVTSRAAPSARAPAGALLCEVDLEFREAAPPIFEPLQIPSAEELTQARLIERPTWRQRASSDEFELTLPPLRTSGRIEVAVQLDCLVITGGLLNCVIAEEFPPGRWFGEFALRISRFYRIDETVRGEPTLGRRVRLPVEVTLGESINDVQESAAPEPVDESELIALAAQAPSRAELDAARLIERPVWVQRPDGDTFVRHYPRTAVERNVSGRAVLECLVQSDGGLRCAIMEEEPPGEGFGLAGLGVARDFRIAAQVDGVTTSGMKVRIPIGFQVE